MADAPQRLTDAGLGDIERLAHALIVSGEVAVHGDTGHQHQPQHAHHEQDEQRHDQRESALAPTPVLASHDDSSVHRMNTTSAPVVALDLRPAARSVRYGVGGAVVLRP